VKATFLIVDACVLIDFAKTDPSLLRLIVDHVGPIHVPTPVLAEVKQLDASMATTLGLRMVDPDFDTAARAATLGGALSFEDRLCLIVAKASGWTCVSNDGRLRRTCEREGVPTLWGLELLLRLFDAGGLPKDQAEEAAEAIHCSNPRYVTKKVLQLFTETLRKMRSR
jgi:rRNA-processing protein FCF1